MKHTPGPWKVEPRDGSIRSAIETELSVEEWPFVIWMPEPPFVLGCTGAAVAVNPNQPEAAEANARLIAAAPELLEACKELREVSAMALRILAETDGALIDKLIGWCREHGIADGFGVRAQNAIAKAESE